MLSLNTSFRVRHPCLTTTPVKCENELSVLAALIQELHVVGKRSHPTRTHQNKLCGQNLINKFHLRSLPPTQAPSTSDMSSAPRPQHPPLPLTGWRRLSSTSSHNDPRFHNAKVNWRSKQPPSQIQSGNLSATRPHPPTLSLWSCCCCCLRSEIFRNPNPIICLLFASC